MISRETISRIRDSADIAAVVGETVKLLRRGRSYVGLCPFHKEKTPSFHVNPERGRFYCFGCKENGSVIDFVMKLEGLTFAEAVRYLAERAGIEIEVEDDAAASSARAARRAELDLVDVLSLAAVFYETQLREHPTASVAREELARRGLTPSSPTDPIADALQAFRVGYAPPGWDGLTSYLVQQRVSLRAAEAVGLITPRKSGSGHYDFFRNRLMFGIVDVQGRVVGFSGRVLADPETGEVDRNTGKYINSPESPVYKKSQLVFGLHQARQTLREQQLAVVVEGNFDVLSLHARGIRQAVAPLGTSFTGAQAKLIRRFSPRAVMLFDGDKAGREAARKSREACREGGLDASVAMLPDGLDPDDFVREHGSEALHRVLLEAKPMLEFLIGLELDKDFTRSDAREQAARIQQVAQLVASEEDPTVRAMAKSYADRLASRLSITDAGTLKTLEAAVRRGLSGRSPEHDVGQISPYRTGYHVEDERVPLNMLGCILDCPELLDDSEVQEAVGLLEGDVALAVGLAHNLRDTDSGENAESFLAHLPVTIHDFAAQRLSRPVHDEAANALIEFRHNAQKLKRRGLSREHAQVVEALDHARARGDANLEDDLLEQAVRKTRERLGL